MESDNVPNVLADRYASPAMKAVWSTRGRVVLEREYLDRRR
jgi:adenylosuccinate lyase